MKILRGLGVLIGLSLAALLIHEVRWHSVRMTLGLLGWKYLLVLIYPLTWMLANTVGWRYGCHPRSLKVRFMEMVKIRLAGETFNSLLPSSYVGGEPIKAKFLSAWMSLRDAASSVLIAKSAQSIGLIIYVGLGLVVGLPSSASPRDHLKAWLALTLLGSGVLIFTWLLANQSFSRLGRFVERATRSFIGKKASTWLQGQDARLVSLDDSLGSFYRDCKGRFVISIFWHGLGWIAGALELWMIFYLIGVPISWRDAWFMGVIAQLGSVIGLISPGGLGFYEGGHYLAAVLLGLPTSLAISVSLIRRIRELFWDLIGLYYFWRYSNAASKTSPV